MKILTLTSLFPNSQMPSLGIFIETRMKQLKQRYSDVQVDVVAPVPWFPLTHPRFGDYAKYAKVPRQEQRNGFTVHHPRYIVIPKVGMYLTPFFMALSLLLFFMRHKVKSHYDLIDGHYYYPDGVAISLVAKLFKIPFTVTARGTDINLIPSYKPAKAMIRYALKSADRNLAVCQALANEMDSLEPNGKPAITVRNGVDLELFSYTGEAAQQVVRDKLDLDSSKPIAVVVGWLIERKGQHLIIDALSQVPELNVYFIGTGSELNKLKARASHAGVSQWCHFVGSKPQSELKDWFGAADFSILASSREGWANVLLESMACGTPVVATDIWGTPEIVSTPDAGVLVKRDSHSIAEGIQALLANSPERSAVRAHAERYSWDETCASLYQLFNELRSSETTTTANGPKSDKGVRDL